MAEENVGDNIAELEEKHLRSLAKNLSNEWTEVASYLDIKHEQVMKLKEDHHGNVNEQIFHMLMMWKRQAHGSDLVGTLKKALESANRKDLAAKLKDDRQPIADCPRNQFDLIKCGKHVGNFKHYYCETCHELICKQCIHQHPDPTHTINDSKETAVKYRQKLEDEIQRMNDEQQALTEQPLKDLEDAERAFDRAVDRALEDTKEAVARLIKDAEAKGKQITEAIGNLRENRSRSFKEKGEELQEQKRRFEKKIEEAEQLSKVKEKWDFLLRYQAVTEKLQKPESPSSASKEIQAQLSYPMFLAGPSVAGIDLGKVVMVDTWRQVDTIGQKGKGRGKFEGARGIAAAKPDKIAVTDRKNDRVVICNSQGNNWQSIDVIANDVVAAQKQWVIVCPEVIKFYSRDNRDAEFVSEFKTLGTDEDPRSVNLISVAVKRDGKILVVDNTKLLTEHSPDGAILHTIPIRITPFFIAVVPEQRVDQLVEYIAVSDRHEPKVYIMEVCDGNMTTIKVIQPILDGTPAMNCRGVCANDSGVFIAATTKSYNEGHVHHYDTRGRFITCVARGLYNPYGVCFTANGQRLAVADFQSVKIYKKQ